MPGIEPHMHWDIYLSSGFISVIFSLLGALKGARSAAKLAPAEAMRPPPPERGGRVLPEMIPLFWKHINFQWKMILRAVFRNPVRSLVTILASAVATGLTLSSFSMYDATYYMMDYHFEKISHEDVTVNIREPKGIKATREMAKLPSVDYCEPQLSVVCDLKHGPRSKRTAVTGLAPHSKLYTPLNKAGNPIIPPEQGLTLTNKLAQILGVKVGDTIKLKPLIAKRKQTEAQVVEIIDTYLGLSAYCDRRYLSNLLGEELAANTYLIDIFTMASADDFMGEVKKRPAVIGVNERARTLGQMRETMGEFMGSFFAIMIVFAGVIAFGSLLNTAMVSLSEREREVGALRVIGYTSGEVWKIFSGEGFVLNALGIFLGIWLGVGLSYLISIGYNTELYRFPVVIYTSRIMLSVFIMLIFLALAQGVIYRMIRNLRWLDSLKIKE
jgi:putative ABC transport system permease protein